MPIFFKRSEEEQQARNQLREARGQVRLAKVQVSTARANLKTAKLVRKQQRTEAKMAKIRQHAEPHSKGHHGGACSGNCRKGRVAHPHRS